MSMRATPVFHNAFIGRHMNYGFILESFDESVVLFGFDAGLKKIATVFDVDLIAQVVIREYHIVEYPRDTRLPFRALLKDLH